MRSLLVLLALTLPVLAQEAVEFVPVGIREDALPVATPRFKNLAVVVDLSGSVRTDAAVTNRVMMAAETLTQFAPDDWALTCIAFADRGVEWSHGWMDMPNGDAPRFVRQFLSDPKLHARLGSGTQVATGIQVAFAHTKPDMLVAVVTDGEVGPADLERVNLIMLQTQRRLKGLPAVPVAFLVTGDLGVNVRGVADLGGGGLFAIR